MRLTRRAALALGAGALVRVTALPGAAHAADETETHGISAFGDLKYGADFKHFEYVNPNAPKGGLFSQVGAQRADGEEEEEHKQSTHRGPPLSRTIEYIIRTTEAIGWSPRVAHPGLEDSPGA